MVLNSWKEIAAHLKTSVRTAQRWERLGLPLHRPRLSNGPVMAFSEDIEEWLKNSPTRILIESAPKDTHVFVGFRYKVLVVDDDAPIREFYSERLSSAGYLVQTAQNGFEALAVMREEGVPDLLVSDLNMPSMSGFELLSIVRRRFPAVAVIAVSGAFKPLNRPTVLADVFLEKNVSDVNLLTDTARDLLSRSPLRAQPANTKEALAWIPCSSDGYIVVTCTDCLRSFSVPASETASSGRELRSTCIHCGTVVVFRIDTASKGSLAPSNHKKIA